MSGETMALLGFALAFTITQVLGVYAYASEHLWATIATVATMLSGAGLLLAGMATVSTEAGA